MPSRRQTLDEIEHDGRLRDAECRRGLVHDHQLRVPHDGLGDRDGLALAARQGADRLTDRSNGGHRQPRQRVGRGLLHRVLVEQAVPQALASQEHVLDDVEVVAEREVLVHGRDAERGRVARASDVHGLAGPADLASVGFPDSRDALDEHRLAGAVVTHQRGDLTGRDVEVDVDQRLHGPKFLSIAHLELELSGGPGSALRPGRSSVSRVRWRLHDVGRERGPGEHGRRRQLVRTTRSGCPPAGRGS